MQENKSPSSIRGYLKSLVEIKEVIRWIRTEILSTQSMGYLKKTIMFSFCVILFQSLTPLGIGKVFSGLSAKELNSVLIGIGAAGMCYFAQKFFERKMAKAREHALSIHWNNIDESMTRRFLEKSPGQHIQENSLSVSGIEKGRHNLHFMQGLIFFEAIPVINQMIVSLGLILYMSLCGWLIMSLAVCLYVLYSLYLNFHVMRVCTPIDKNMRRINRKRSERMEKAIRVIVSSQEKREVRDLTNEFQVELKKDLNFWLWFIEQSTWRSLINISLLMAVIGYGANLVWRGEWQIGLLYPLIAWSIRISENIWHLADIEHKVNWCLPAVKAMIKALSIVPDVTDIEHPIVISKEKPLPIALHTLSHLYPQEAQPSKDTYNEEEEDVNQNSFREETPHTLKKISFTIEPGEKVALIGPSGAGKTTIMRLLLRHMDPAQGSITVDGIDLRNIQKNSWLQCIGYIAQHPEVFDGTIRENLTYRLSDEERMKVTDEDLWELMRRLEIDFGTRLDRGLDTRVGKHGLKLSGGQAQRLMIGAAVIGHPWFMVIDEATSSLDSTTERKVQQGLSKILSGNTSALIVAHRLSTVRHLCTKFVVLRPSADVDNGQSQVEAIASSFEELYPISPTFRQLADDQEISVQQAHKTEVA